MTLSFRSLLELGSDGKFYFEDFILPAGNTVRFVGSNAVEIRVMGKVEIEGRIECNGADMTVFGARDTSSGALLAGQVSIAILFLVGLLAAQVLHWMIGDKRFGQAGSTMETATGLGPIGKVRLLEPPHTGPNYLLHEMAFQVGRKHSWTLRVISVLTIGVVPILILLALPAGHVAAALALILHVLGLFAARWLFFAEAEHVQALYYGRHAGA